MKGIYIRNWSIWQTYRRGRNPPPWIKLHKVLLNDPSWNMLSDSEKGQLVSLWLVGSSRDGELPYDAGLLRKVCLLDNEPNIERFLELGFLTLESAKADVSSTSERRPPGDIDDAPEEKRVEKREEQKETDTPVKIPSMESASETEELRVANFLADEILRRGEKYSHLVNGKRTKTVTAWAAEIEKLHRIDGREWPEIWKVSQWSQKDNFWSKNILSGKKLREKFSDLLLKMPQKQQGPDSGFNSTGKRLI